MAGHGPPPKQAEQRRGRAAPSRGEWVEIPTTARRTDAPPALPARNDDRAWRPETIAWWERLWANPVATMWDADDDELARLAYSHQKFWSGDTTSAETTEMRQIEDRHGLNPKGLRDLRWRLVDGEGIPDETARAAAPKRSASARRKRALKIIPGGA